MDYEAFFIAAHTIRVLMLLQLISAKKPEHSQVSMTFMEMP